MKLYYPLLLDGATGTELQKKGFTGGKSTEEWVLENPDALRELHNGYIESGSRIVFTPTFGANRVKLSERGLGDRTVEWNKALVKLVRENAAGRAFVCGDIGPTGKFIAPVGDMTFEELVDVYTEQAQALEEAGVDLFDIETMMTVPEIRAALLAVKRVSNKPVLVSVTCDENGRTLTGTDITATMFIAEGMGADVFGLNCSTGPDEMLSSIRRLSEYAEVPLLAKPNAGLPEVIGNETIYRCSPEDFTVLMPDFAAAGVAVFGGCCGTTKEHIAVLGEVLKDIQPAAPKGLPENMLPLATEKDSFLLPVNVKTGEVFDCDDDLPDVLEEAEDRGGLISLRIDSDEALENFEEYAYAIRNPLCIVTDDEVLLEKALRIFQGRALYEGGLSEAFLKRMASRYGLIY